MVRMSIFEVRMSKKVVRTFRCSGCRFSWFGYRKGGSDLDLGVPDVDFRGSDVEKGSSDPRNNLP